MRALSEPCRLCLSWAIGIDATLSRLVAEWPSLKRRLHYVVQTRSSDVRRRNNRERDFFTEARKVIVYHVDCTSEWELPHRYSSWTLLAGDSLYSKICWKLEAKKGIRNLVRNYDLTSLTPAKPPNFGSTSSRRLASQKSGTLRAIRSRSRKSVP